MKIQKQTAGFAHYLLIAAVLVVVATGATFFAVLKAHHHIAASDVKTTTSGTNQKKLNTSAQSQAGASAVASSSKSNASISGATSTSRTSSTSSGSPSGGTSSTTSGGGSPTTNPSPPAAPTTLDCLTKVIQDLENGISANVTIKAYHIPGPVGTATGRPIIFSCNGSSYFAYTQGTPPNFNTSVSETANSMAITPNTPNAPPTSAHLDKSNELVDDNFQLVGYSTGGN